MPAISGVSKTQLTGTTVKTVSFDNSTILKSIVATGTSGVTKTSDLDIVITPDDLEVDVIIKATHDVLRVLGDDGSLSHNGMIQTESRTSIEQVMSANAFTFTFPAASAPFNANILLTTSAKLSTGQYSRIVMSFNGGNYPATPATFIMGSLRFTGRIYRYGG